MQIPKLKLHSPKLYDNTEADLIIVPPSVLDGKLRDFEQRNQVRASLPGWVAVAVTLLVAILGTTFKDFSFISGPTIKGAFIVGLLVVLIKIGYDIYRIVKTNKQGRLEIIDALKQHNISDHNKQKDANSKIK